MKKLSTVLIMIYSLATFGQTSEENKMSKQYQNFVNGIIMYARDLNPASKGKCEACWLDVEMDSKKWDKADLKLLATNMAGSYVFETLKKLADATMVKENGVLTKDALYAQKALSILAPKNIKGVDWANIILDVYKENIQEIVQVKLNRLVSDINLSAKELEERGFVQILTGDNTRPLNECVALVNRQVLALAKDPNKAEQFYHLCQIAKFASETKANSKEYTKIAQYSQSILAQLIDDSRGKDSWKLLYNAAIDAEKQTGTSQVQEIIERERASQYKAHEKAEQQGK